MKGDLRGEDRREKRRRIYNKTCTNYKKSAKITSAFKSDSFRLCMWIGVSSTSLKEMFFDIRGRVINKHLVVLQPSC